MMINLKEEKLKRKIIALQNENYKLKQQIKGLVNDYDIFCSDELEKIRVPICTFYQVNKNLFFSRERSEKISLVRQVFCYFAYNYTGYSLSDVGKHISRDHATVLHACNTIENLIQNNTGNQITKGIIRGIPKLKQILLSKNAIQNKLMIAS